MVLVGKALTVVGGGFPYGAPPYLRDLATNSTMKHPKFVNFEQIVNFEKARIRALFRS